MSKRDENQLIAKNGLPPALARKIAQAKLKAEKEGVFNGNISQFYSVYKSEGGVPEPMKIGEVGAERAPPSVIVEDANDDDDDDGGLDLDMLQSTDTTSGVAGMSKAQRRKAEVRQADTITSEMLAEAFELAQKEDDAENGGDEEEPQIKGDDRFSRDARRRMDKMMSNTLTKSFAEGQRNADEYLDDDGEYIDGSATQVFKERVGEINKKKMEDAFAARQAEVEAESGAGSDDGEGFFDKAKRKGSNFVPDFFKNPSGFSAMLSGISEDIAPQIEMAVKMLVGYAKEGGHQFLELAIPVLKRLYAFTRKELAKAFEYTLDVVLPAIWSLIADVIGDVVSIVVNTIVGAVVTGVRSAIALAKFGGSSGASKINGPGEVSLEEMRSGAPDFHGKFAHAFSSQKMDELLSSEDGVAKFTYNDGFMEVKKGASIKPVLLARGHFESCAGHMSPLEFNRKFTAYDARHELLSAMKIGESVEQRGKEVVDINEALMERLQKQREAMAGTDDEDEDEEDDDDEEWNTDEEGKPLGHALPAATPADVSSASAPVDRPVKKLDPNRAAGLKALLGGAPVSADAVTAAQKAAEAGITDLPEAHAAVEQYLDPTTAETPAARAAVSKAIETPGLLEDLSAHHGGQNPAVEHAMAFRDERAREDAAREAVGGIPLPPPLTATGQTLAASMNPQYPQYPRFNPQPMQPPMSAPQGYAYTQYPPPPPPQGYSYQQYPPQSVPPPGYYGVPQVYPAGPPPGTANIVSTMARGMKKGMVEDDDDDDDDVPMEMITKQVRKRARRNPLYRPEEEDDEDDEFDDSVRAVADGTAAARKGGSTAAFITRLAGGGAEVLNTLSQDENVQQLGRTATMEGANLGVALGGAAVKKAKKKREGLEDDDSGDKKKKKKKKTKSKDKGKDDDGDKKKKKSKSKSKDKDKKKKSKDAKRKKRKAKKTRRRAKRSKGHFVDADTGEYLSGFTDQERRMHKDALGTQFVPHFGANADAAMLEFEEYDPELAELDFGGAIDHMATDPEFAEFVAGNGPDMYEVGPFRFRIDPAHPEELYRLQHFHHVLVGNPVFRGHLRSPMFSGGLFGGTRSTAEGLEIINDVFRSKESIVEVQETARKTAKEVVDLIDGYVMKKGLYERGKSRELERFYGFTARLLMTCLRHVLLLRVYGQTDLEDAYPNLVLGERVISFLLKRTQEIAKSMLDQFEEFKRPYSDVSTDEEGAGTRPYPAGGSKDFWENFKAAEKRSKEGVEEKAEFDRLRGELNSKIVYWATEAVERDEGMKHGNINEQRAFELMRIMPSDREDPTDDGFISIYTPELQKASFGFATLFSSMLYHFLEFKNRTVVRMFISYIAEEIITPAYGTKREVVDDLLRTIVGLNLRPEPLVGAKSGAKIHEAALKHAYKTLDHFSSGRQPKTVVVAIPKHPAAQMAFQSGDIHFMNKMTFVANGTQAGVRGDTNSAPYADEFGNRWTIEVNPPGALHTGVAFEPTAPPSLFENNEFYHPVMDIQDSANRARILVVKQK